MSKFFSFALLAVFAFAFAHVTTYKVDTAASSINWTGRKVTGKHTGTVGIKSGMLLVDHGTLTGGSFAIDMPSIACTDLEGDMAKKLEGHLKSADFFGVEAHPTATLEITKAIAVDTKGQYKIMANLTIKETTKEIKFYANVSESDAGLTATADITIDRSEFDVRYGSGSFIDGLGDKTIYDEFDLQVSLVAKK